MSVILFPERNPLFVKEGLIIFQNSFCYLTEIIFDAFLS